MGEDNNNNFSLNNEKGEFIINKETNKEEPEITEEQGEFVVNKEENLEENTNKENINGNENLLKNHTPNLNHSEKEQGEFNIKKDNIVEDNTHDTKTEKNIDEIKPSYNDFSNPYIFKSVEEMEKIKKENKKNLKILLIAFIFLFTAIGVAVTLFFSSYEKGYKSYIENGISSDEYFKISPNSFIDLQKYYMDNYYNEYIDEYDIEKLGDFKFNEEKGYYEEVNNNTNFSYQIYTSENGKKIEKIVISYNWLKGSKEAQDSAYYKFDTYISIVYASIWGLDNYTFEEESKMWDNLLNTEYDYEKNGIGNFKSEYKDEKAIYSLEEKNDGTIFFTFSPIK